jgi:hypothetical protein
MSHHICLIVELIDLDVTDLHTAPTWHTNCLIVTINLYRDDHEINRMIVTQKTKKI